MVTPGNDRVTQVNAGRAYARVQLAATAHGLATQPLSQALQEYAEQRKPLCRYPRIGWSHSPGQDGADVGARGVRTDSRARTAAAFAEFYACIGGACGLGVWAIGHPAQVKEEPAQRAGNTEQNALLPRLLAF